MKWKNEICSASAFNSVHLFIRTVFILDYGELEKLPLCKFRYRNVMLLNKRQIFTQVSALRVNQGYTAHVNMGV